MVKDESVRNAIAVIREIYVNKELGEKVALALEEFLETQVAKHRITLEDAGAFIYELNAIVTSLTHDMHFGFFTANSLRGLTGGGIIRVSPHYIQMVHIDDMAIESVRITYQQVFEQVQDPLLIDLRNCSGGEADAMFFILCHFFPDETPLFELRTRINPPRIFKSSSVAEMYPTYNTVKKYTGRLKILVNGFTYSGGEIIAKTLQSYKRALIFGTPTAGSVRPTRTMVFDDLRLQIPYATLIDIATGEDYEGVGVKPDFGPPSREYIFTIFTDVADNAFIYKK